jgi:hypothetical protein
VTPAEDRTHRMAFARLLGTWSKKGVEDDGPAGLLTARIDRFGIASPSDLIRVLGKPGPSTSDLYWSRYWIRGPMIRVGSPPFVPMATAYVRTHEVSGELEASIRVGLFYESGNSVHSSGWRFESPDKGENVVHPYPHAQPIDEWVKGDSIDSGHISTAGSYQATNADRGINERRPAFPLRGASTVCGLVVAALATLHGAPMVKRWLQELPHSDIPSMAWQDIGETLG